MCTTLAAAFLTASFVQLQGMIQNFARCTMYTAALLTTAFFVSLQGMIQSFVRSTLSLTFVVAAARVVYNINASMARETSWQLELKGDLTKQRRLEAVDKLLSVMTLLVSLIFGLQALGLDGKPSHCICQVTCHFNSFRVAVRQLIAPVRT